MLQPLAEDALLEALQGVRYVLSVEEHYVECGLGGIMQGIKTRRDPSWKLQGLGIPAGFIHTIKNQQGMRKQFGISAGEIAKSVTVLMEESNETVTQRRHAAA
jgi:transketolase C-terminal domain/subunit